MSLRQNTQKSQYKGCYCVYWLEIEPKVYLDAEGLSKLNSQPLLLFTVGNSSLFNQVHFLFSLVVPQNKVPCGFV